MSEVLPSLGFQVGAGALGGFLVGFAIKKISKLIAVVVGLFLLVLIYLSTQGILNIDYDALWTSVNSAFSWLGSAFSWVVGVISLLPFAGSFIVGFLLGLKLG